MELRQLEPPTKQDYLQWREMYVTKCLVQALFNKREMLKEGLAEGHSGDLTNEIQKVIGRCQAHKDDIDYIIHEFEVLEVEVETNEETQ